MVTRDMRPAFGATVSDLVDRDDRVAVVLSEISTQYFTAAMRAHPDRVVNIGIMEQAMVGVAAGFAMEGFLPVAHSLSPFMAERPYEQLKLDFGYQGLAGTFVGVGGSYDYASEGGTHHAPADAGLMLGIPRMEVLIPGHGDEVDRLLRDVRERSPDVPAGERDEQCGGPRGRARPARGAPTRHPRDGRRVRPDARSNRRGVCRAGRHAGVRHEPPTVRHRWVGGDRWRTARRDLGRALL